MASVSMEKLKNLIDRAKSLNIPAPSPRPVTPVSSPVKVSGCGCKKK